MRILLVNKIGMDAFLGSYSKCIQRLSHNSCHYCHIPPISASHSLQIERRTYSRSNELSFDHIRSVGAELWGLEDDNLKFALQAFEKMCCLKNFMMALLIFNELHFRFVGVGRHRVGWEEILQRWTYICMCKSKFSKAWRVTFKWSSSKCQNVTS